MRRKLLPLYLDAATYRLLVEQAAAHEREPAQQVAWLLRRALTAPSPAPMPAGATYEAMPCDS